MSDIWALHNSHMTALEIAFDVWGELDDAGQSNILQIIEKAFEDWQNLYDQGQDKTESPPWNYNDLTTTPIRFFLKLVIRGYAPLKEYLLDQPSARLDHLLAALILLSYREDLHNASMDCIEGALHLSKIRNSFVRVMQPAAEKEFNRKQAQRAAIHSKKEETKRAVRMAFIELTTHKDGPPKNLQSVLAKKVGISQSQVSKVLAELDLETKKLDSAIHAFEKNIHTSTMNK